MIHVHCSYTKTICIFTILSYFFVISATGQFTVTLPIDDDSLAMVKVNLQGCLYLRNLYDLIKIVSFELVLILGKWLPCTSVYPPFD